MQRAIQCSNVLTIFLCAVHTNKTRLTVHCVTPGFHPSVAVLPLPFRRSVVPLPFFRTVATIAIAHEDGNAGNVIPYL